MFCPNSYSDFTTHRFLIWNWKHEWPCLISSRDSTFIIRYFPSGDHGQRHWCLHQHLRLVVVCWHGLGPERISRSPDRCLRICQCCLLEVRSSCSSGFKGMENVKIHWIVWTKQYYNEIVFKKLDVDIVLQTEQNYYFFLFWTFFK